MMADGLDMSAFWDEFQAEAQELIQAVTQGLLRLEQSPDDLETVRELGRAIHTLKGSARLMGLDKLNRLTHRMEDMLDAISQGDLSFTPATADLVLKALDLVSAATENARQTGEEGIEIDEICDRIDRAAAGELRASTEKAGEVKESLAEPESPSSETASEAEAFTVFDKRLPEKRGDPRSRRDPPAEPAAPSRQASSESEAKLPPVPSTEGPAREAGKSRRPASSETIRVDTRKLDNLANVTGEMVVNLLKFEAIADSVRGIIGTTKQHIRVWQQLRDELASTVTTLLGKSGVGADWTKLEELIDRCDKTNLSVFSDLEGLSQRLNEDTMRVAANTRKLEEDVMSIRMHPVSTVFNSFPRAVRDLARDLGKPVDLVVEGGETELDRKILETIRDPLLHLVRNAVYHGIESATEREKTGKKRDGVVRLSAWQQGDQVLVQVSDDGRGIDPATVRRAAVSKGLIDESTGEALTRDDCLRLVFEPGFSTRSTVDDISGRGVGMDVVKATVEEMHGEVLVESELGEGTRVTLSLPLTLAISRALLIRSAGRRLAIPTASVETTVKVKREEVKSVEGKEAIIVRNATVPIFPLSRILGVDGARPPGGNENLHVLVLCHSQQRFGFIVEELIGEQEIVVKPLGAPLKRVKNVAGAAILGGSEVVVVLHVPDIVAAARAALLTQAVHERVGQDSAPPRKRVLVVEDSLTARELERSMFEAAGYEVVTAADGIEGLEKLTNRTVDVIVTDVQMPRMDGFEMTSRLRSDDRYRDVPVIIVTTRSDESDRQRGLDVGADAYLIKSSLSPSELLECTRRLVG